MATASLEDAMRRADDLSLPELLELASYALEKARRRCPPQGEGRRWSDLRGLAAHPLVGQDAQEWVSRWRQESDDSRALRGHRR